MIHGFRAHLHGYRTHLLVVAAALLVVATGLLVARSGIRPVVLVGDSMAPDLRRGDLLVTVRVPATAVVPGDVVSRPDGVTHRVVAVGHGAAGAVLTTRGDANAAVDPVPLRTPTVRRVAGAIPAVGHAFLAVRPLPARAATVLVVVAAAAVWRELHRGGASPARPAVALGTA